MPPIDGDGSSANDTKHNVVWRTRSRARNAETTAEVGHTAARGGARKAGLDTVGTLLYYALVLSQPTLR